ncbi:MBL fold metallo-hydrolase [bacterium]|nr:MBL fold metallo-hydrolase [bacterium]
MKIKIHLLGTASGIPTKNRYNECVALIIDGNVYLLDAGEPCSASLIRKGIDYNKIRAVFISHMDADHFAGVPMLIQTIHLMGKREKPLKLFLPQAVTEKVKKYLEMMYLMDEILSFKIEFLPIKSDPVYEDECISFFAYPNNHIKSRLKDKVIVRHPDIQMDSFSFCIITRNNKKIVYTGDIENVQELENFIDGTDLLLTEMAHIKPEELFKYLSGKKISKIICLHIHPDLENREKECLSMSKKYLGNKVKIGHDGMEVEL